MNRTVGLAMFMMACCVDAGAGTPSTLVKTIKQWPDVLVIDDFESGLGRWENQDSGALRLVEGANGGKALLWMSSDDSVGQIVFKGLNRQAIDFSQYEILAFRVRIDGRPLWNLNPVIQQYPAVYGFQGLYYSIDTMHPFGKWYTFAQDLSRWENAWPDTFDAEKQEFRFEVIQLAGPGRTKVYLDDIRLLKNPIGLKPSYPGRWAALPDGGQVTHFGVAIKNKKDKTLTVHLGLDPEDSGTLKRFQIEIAGENLRLLPGEERTVAVALVAPRVVLADAPPWYGETARLAVHVDETPALVLHTELVAGSRPTDVSHPSILCDAARMRRLHAQYDNPAERAEMEPALLRLVAAGEAALAYEPEYPPLAGPGRDTDPVSKNKLQRIEVPNLPFDVYQDSKSGRTYSGPLYDAGMKGWANRHLENAAKAHTLGVAYLVSGRKEFAQAAARILRAYADRYLALPIMAYEPGSPVGSACSGSVRIGGTYMRERVWLTHLAVALDSIRSSDVLSEADVAAIAEKVFVPSATLMQDHQIGVMNLQWQIESAALYAGLAAGHPGLVARAVYDGHGILRLFALGYLPDGNWWENPSYQTVTNLCAYPVLGVCLRNGILRWNERFSEILTSIYRLAGPDGLAPELGTGGSRGFDLDDTAARVCAPLADDPRLAWVALNRKPAVWVGETYLMAILSEGKPKTPTGKTVCPIATGTVDFPYYGGIALRVPGTDAYCYLHYGREVTHGHRNKLSIHAYGKGGWYMRNVMGGYQNNFKDFLETIASSTSIMLDGRDANCDTGELLLKKSGDGFELAVAREIGAWTDAEHERTVVLTRGPLVVVDRCTSDREHVYDWLYHANRCGLSLDSQIALSPAPEKLGDTPRYSGLIPAGCFPSVGAAAWKRADGSGLRMAFLPRGELFHINVKDTSRPSEGLVWRQHGRNCVFAAVLWPHRNNETGDVNIEELKTQGRSGGVAVRVTVPEGVYTILVNPTSAVLRAGGVETTERAAVFLRPRD